VALFAASLAFPAAIILIGLFAPHIYLAPENAYLVFGGDEPPAGAVPLSGEPWITRIAGVVDLAIATVPVALILWHLRALFGLYARGIVFARENAQHLQRIGLWLILYLPAKFVSNMIFQFAGGADKNWFHVAQVHALLLGAIVLVIALVMEVGREIEQERSEFV
jgi:hypothetical protein